MKIRIGIYHKAGLRFYAIKSGRMDTISKPINEQLESYLKALNGEIT